MENKKHKNLKIIFYIILFSFIFVYASGKSGYYESTIKKNTLITSEAIKEFEKDVSEGKAVDIKDYINAEVSDYRNKYSRLGYSVSKIIDSVLNEGVKHFSNFLKSLFT